MRIDTGLEQVARQKAEIGLGAASDADRVAADVAQARANVEDLTSQLHASRRRLLILIGRATAPVDSISLSNRSRRCAAAASLHSGRPASPQTGRARGGGRPAIARRGTAKLRHWRSSRPSPSCRSSACRTRRQPSTGYNPATGAALTRSARPPASGSGPMGRRRHRASSRHLPGCCQTPRPRTRGRGRRPSPMKRRSRPPMARPRTPWSDLAAGKRAADVLADGEARAHRASDAAPDPLHDGPGRPDHRAVRRTGLALDPLGPRRRSACRRCGARWPPIRRSAAAGPTQPWRKPDEIRFR